MKEEFVAKILNMILDEHTDEDLKAGKITEKRAGLIKRKHQLMGELHLAKDNLEEYLDNDYDGIAELVNEQLEKEITLYKETAEKCKKWLDDNNLPYKTEDEEED